MSTEFRPFQSADAGSVPLGKPTSGPMSRRFTDERARQLEGQSGDSAELGVWPESVMRVQFGWGNLLETDWPYLVESGGLNRSEPPDANRRAKAYRAAGYQRLRSAADVLAMLAAGQTPGIGLWITEQWYRAPHGVIALPQSSREFVGTHYVTIVGVDVENQVFQFRNSWGLDWGARGYGWLPWSYVERCFYSSWVSFGRGQPETSPNEDPRIISVVIATPLTSPVNGRGPVHMAMRYDAEADERLGWFIAVPCGPFLDVEDLFVRPAYREKGLGAELTEKLQELAFLAGKALRLWVPMADWTPENRPRVEAVALRLGLRLAATSVPWAAAVGIPDRLPAAGFELSGALHEAHAPLAPPEPSQFQADHPRPAKKLPSESTSRLSRQLAALARLAPLQEQVAQTMRQAGATEADLDRILADDE